MAIAHKESLGTDLGTGFTTPDLNNIASPAAGDFLLAGVYTNSGHTVSVAPSGWTAIVEGLEDSAGDSAISVYHKIAGASEPATYTDFLTFANAESGGGFVSAWTGVDQTTPLDVAALSEGSTSANAHDSPAITPVTSGAVLVAVFSADPGGARTFTWDVGIDKRLDFGTAADAGYVTIGSKTWGGSGAETLGGDIDSAEPMAELVIALRPAGAPAVTFVPKIMIF